MPSRRPTSCTNMSACLILREGFDCPSKPRRLHDAMQKSFARLCTAMDARAKAVETARTQIERDLVSRLADPDRNKTANATQASEIRAYFRSLTQTVREKELRAAAAAGNRQVLDALLGAPSFLSDLDDATRSYLVDEAAKVLAPTEHAQLHAADAVLVHIDRVNRDFAASYKKLLPRVSAAAHRKGKAHDAISALANG